jgi:plastocyanin
MRGSRPITNTSHPDRILVSLSGAGHSVTSDDGRVDSGLKNARTFCHTFSSAGTYTYHCSIHGAAMTGTIVVQ